MAIMQFPGTNFHDLNLDWLLSEMKKCLEQWASTQDDWHELQANNTEFKEFMTGQWEGFRDFVLNYLHNLPLTEEVSAKIDAMVEDGTLLEIITYDEGEGSALSDVAAQWLDAHITQETGYVIDDSLTVEGAAADAKATGDAITDLKGSIETMFPVVETNKSNSKNLFAITSSELDVERYGLTFGRKLNGAYTINGTATNMRSGKNYAITWLFGATDYSKSVLPAGTYYFSLTDMVNVSFITIKYVYGTDSSVSSTTIVSHNNPTAKITFTETAHVFIQISSGKTFENASFRCQIEACEADATEPTDFVQPAGLIDYDARKQFADFITELGSPYPVANEIGYKNYRSQGGCLAGDLYQWLLYNSQGVVNRHWINVKNGITGGQTLETGTDKLGHCQDITYNPTENAFYVATSLPTGAIEKLDSQFADVTTIYLVDGSDNPVVASGIAYDRLNNRYIVESSTESKFYIYDENWTYVSAISIDTQTPTVRQGIDTDGYYIYKTRTEAGGATNPHIDIYGINDGLFYGETNAVEAYGQEIEGIAYDWQTGLFYANFNAKDGVAKTTVYKVLPNLPHNIINAMLQFVQSKATV